MTPRATSIGSGSLMLAAFVWRMAIGRRGLATDELDACAGGGREVALAAPDERHRQMDGRVQAAHLEGGSFQGGERPREDGGGEASRGERAQEKRVAAFEREAQWRTGVGEPLLQCG